MLETLRHVVRELEQDRSLERPERLRERVRAMEQLEDLLLHEAAGIDALALEALRRRARARHAALSEVQSRLCDAIRMAVVQGAGTHALSGWVHREDLRDPWGYDHFDALVGDVLALQEPASCIAERDEDMVFYQPTPARHVFDLLDRARLGREDVVVDLGSGMGHVPLLVAICTEASACGIEREQAYVSAARHAASALRVERATFVAQDAREADLSSGTLFYLYTPFTGELLRHVLDRLRDEAARRSFRLATLGPCTPMVAREPWLRAAGTPDADRVTLFRSVA